MGSPEKLTKVHMSKSEPDRHELVKRLLILDEERRCLYGRRMLEEVAASRKASHRVYKVEGVSAAVFVVYMAYEFGQVPECGRALRLLDEGRIDYDLLAAISDKVQLTFDDLEQIRELHFRSKAGGKN